MQTVSIVEAQTFPGTVVGRLDIPHVVIELCAFPDVKPETVVVTETRSILSLGLSRMIDGSEARRAGDRRMPFVRFGALSFRPAGIPMEMHIAGGAFHSIRCRFAAEGAGALARREFSEAELAGCFDIRVQAIEEVMLRLAEEVAHPAADSAALAQSLVHTALIDFTRHLDRARAGAGHRKGGLPPHVLRRVLERIDRLDSVPAINELAAIAGLSRFHFMRCFAQATGSSPGAFIQRARIARAKALLAGERRSLREIARALGYANDAAFSAAFRHATGRSPGAYRDTLR